MDRYDAIVIGTGPAGLEAAITLKIRNKSVLVVGNAGVSAKVEKAHEINNYLGIPAVKGCDLAKQFREHAESLGVEIVEKPILAVYAMGEYFSLTTKTDEMLEASTVVIATGINFGKPYPGEEEFLGRGVSYCATCDAPLYKGKRAVVIGANPKEEAEAEFLAEVASEVVYVPLYKDDTHMSDKVKVVRDVPVEIKGGLKATDLVLKNQTINTDGIFILRENVSPGQLVPGLKVEDNCVVVNRKMETSVPGCFACGDITGAPFQYIKAAGEGNVAALSVVDYLNKKAKEEKEN